MRAATTSCLIHHVDLDAPRVDLTLPSGATHVLVVVHHEGIVLAHVLVAASGTLGAAAQDAAIGPVVGPIVARHRARRDVEVRLGRPAAGPQRAARSVTAAVLITSGAAPLHDCLTSIRALRRAPDEILVLDAGTAADIADTCSRLGAERVPVPANDVGAAWNHAIDRAGSELLACTHSAAVVDERWLDGIDAAFDDCRTAIVTGYVGPAARPGALQPLPDTRLIPSPRGGAAAVDADGDRPVPASGGLGSAVNLVARRELPGWHLRVPAGIEARPEGLTERMLFVRLMRAGYRIRHDPARIAWLPPAPAPGAIGRLRRGRALARAVRRLGWRPAVVAPPPPPPPRAVARDVAITRELPSVTYAIASYDRRDALREVLEAVARQRYPADRTELVVVLDGSTDGSAEMVRSTQLPVAVRLIEQPNSGLARARNVAARAARHPVVIFSDDDIVPEPDCLAEHAAAHARTRQDTWVIGLTPPVVGDGWIDRWIRGWWLDRYAALAEPGHRWGFLDVTDGNASTPVRLWDRLGGHDEAFSGRRQDHELGVRMVAAGIPIALAERAVGLHHVTITAESIIRQAYEEAPYDLALAARHPDTGSQLWLGREERVLHLARLGLGSPRWLDRWAGLTEALSRLPVSGPAERVLGLAGLLAYAEGLRRADPRARCGTRTLTPVTVPLDGPPEPPAFGPDALVRYTDHGRFVLHVRASMPGDQFTWDGLVDRSVKALGR